MKKHNVLSILAALALAAALPLLAAPDEEDERGEHGPRGWEHFSERHDVNGDGQVTREELVQTLDVFDRLDADGDGAVSETDFAAHRVEMAFGFAARHADEDRDDEVTAAEWDAWFAARDTDDDGELTEADRPDRARGRRGPRGHHGALATALDADGDGAVTRADFAALAARFDVNGDGVLAGDELPEVRHRGFHGRHAFHGRH